MKKQRLYTYIKFASVSLFILCFQLIISSNAYAKSGWLTNWPDPTEVEGVGIWVAEGTVIFDTPEEDDPEIKGYADLLPETAKARGGAVTWKISSFAFNFGFESGELEIGKYADVKQTPDVSSDDIFVTKASQTNRTYIVFYHPVLPFFVGLGRREVQMKFEQDSSETKKKYNFTQDFLVTAVNIAFVDPTKSGFQPVITAFINMPIKNMPFMGTVYGVGIGAFFGN